MAWRCAEMNKLRVARAADLARVPDGRIVRIIGSGAPASRQSLTPSSRLSRSNRYKFAMQSERFRIIDGILQTGRRHFGESSKDPQPTARPRRRRRTISVRACCSSSIGSSSPALTIKPDRQDFGAVLQRDKFVLVWLLANIVRNMFPSRERRVNISFMPSRRLRAADS